MNIETTTPETMQTPAEDYQKSKTLRRSMWTSGIVYRAIWDSFLKLNPRTLMKNPVMFVVEVGAVITSIDLIRYIATHAPGTGFAVQITLWLWFTVLFA